LIRSLGGIAWFAVKRAPKYTHKGEDRVGRDCYIITMTLRFNPFRLPRKAKSWRSTSSKRRKIVAVEHIRNEETQCIRVSSKRSLYVTDDYIVTHNTLASLSLHDPSRGPLVILAPLDVRQVWTDWVAKVFPGGELLTLEGHTVDVQAIRAADFIFAHYDILAHQRLTSLTPGTLIVDEAHLLSNSDSQRSKSVRFFAGMAKRVIVSTGTPLWNSVKGLWPLLATANPGAWGEKPFTFRQRYASPTVTEFGWKYGEISNAEEWHARRNEVVFQADWKTERPDLTPATRRFIDVPLHGDELIELDMAAESLRSLDVEDSVIGVIGRYRQMTGHLKVTASAVAALEGGEPSVVWTWHKGVAKAVQDVLKKQGREAFLIHGGKGENVKKRLASIDRWRDSRDGVLCATMAVGQVGIDLSHAKRAVFTEIDWTPAVMYQAEMRTFDPERSMELIYPRVEHPVERMLVDKLLAKLARAETSSMPAAGSGFSLENEETDGDQLLAALDEIISHSSADF
jgi:hypothetical protein